MLVKDTAASSFPFPGATEIVLRYWEATEASLTREMDE